MSTKMTGAQVRAARALLGWTADYLAWQSDVSRMTIQRIEKRHWLSPPTSPASAAVAKALEQAGIDFLVDDKKSIAVVLNLKRFRLRRKCKPSSTAS